MNSVARNSQTCPGDKLYLFRSNPDIIITQITLMQRRNFIKNTALCAMAVSTSGFIRFNGTNYEGDCETTTDILGPFYRPDAPVRNNLLVKNATGQEVILNGIVKHKDCIRPLNNACVE